MTKSYHYTEGKWLEYDDGIKDGEPFGDGLEKQIVKQGFSTHVPLFTLLGRLRVYGSLTPRKSAYQWVGVLQVVEGAVRVWFSHPSDVFRFLQEVGAYSDEA